MAKTWLKALIFVAIGATASLWFTFPRGKHPERRFTETDIQDLRAAFPDFIKERIISEKQKGKLKCVSIRSKDQKEEGVVHL